MPFELDAAQRAAAHSVQSHIAVIAGAGSGKTATLVARVLRLLANGVAPEQILVITFTHKAARELVERIRNPDVTVRTFHSLAVQVIREDPRLVNRKLGFAIWGEDDQIDAIHRCADDAGFKVPKRDPFKALGDSDVLGRYLAFMAECNALDFDRMESGLLNVFRKRGGEYRDRWTHVLVDEYQDTSEVQHAVLLSHDPENLFVVGDPRQGIYAWRNATIENFLLVMREPDTEVHLLSTNYRSRRDIVQFANRIAACMGTDWAVPMEAWQGNAPGACVTSREWPTDVDEAADIAEQVKFLFRDGVKAADVAVLARSWSYLDLIAKVLRKEGIKVVVGRDVKGGRVWNTDKAMWLRRALRFGLVPDDSWTSERVAMDLRGVATGSVRGARFRHETTGQPFFVVSGGRLRECLEHVSQRVVAWSANAVNAVRALTELPECPVDRDDREVAALDEWSFLREANMEERGVEDFLEWVACTEIEDDSTQTEEPTDEVMLSTVHGFKGLERDHVFLAGMSDGVFPSGRTIRGSKAAREEERRVFYVAATRPRETLRISWAQVRTNVMGPRREQPRSRLLEEVSDAGSA